MNDNDKNLNELNSNDSNETRGHFEEVPVYANILSANRRNFQPNGFNFDADLFENLIDSYATPEEIMDILSFRCKHKVNEAELDKFCKILYGYNFRETYKTLIGITNVHMKKVFKNLAASGNATAISVNARHFMKLEDENKNDAINIRIVNDLEDNK